MDGGVLLLWKVDWGFRLTERLTGCFRDHRSVARIKRRLETLVAPRVLGLEAGYEDLNDHDRLRADGVLALASGRARTAGPRRTRLTAPTEPPNALTRSAACSVCPASGRSSVATPNSSWQGPYRRGANPRWHNPDPDGWRQCCRTPPDGIITGGGERSGLALTGGCPAI